MFDYYFLYQLNVQNHQKYMYAKYWKLQDFQIKLGFKSNSVNNTSAEGYFICVFQIVTDTNTTGENG